MLEKIYTSVGIEKFVQIYNNEIKPIFDNYLEREEKKNLSFFLEKEDLKEKENFFYKNNSEIIGLISYRYKTNKIIYISEFHILKKFQKKWFGNQMMRDLEEYLSQKWVEIIYLETHYKYIWAIRFYRKNNFIYISPEDLQNSPLRKIYKSLVKNSRVFYKKLQ